MAHNRKLLVGIVGLVPGKVRNDVGAGTAARDLVEPLLVEDGWFEAAPFATVGLIIRYGERSQLEPTYQRIRGTHRELPISIELPMKALQRADAEQLTRIFAAAMIEALLSVAAKYRLPDARLREKKEDLGVHLPGHRHVTSHADA